MTVIERCPTCEAPMDLGRLAVNARKHLGSSVVWEPPEGIIRHGKPVLDAGVLGGHTRPAWRCPECETIVLPPPEPED